MNIDVPVVLAVFMPDASYLGQLVVLTKHVVLSDQGEKLNCYTDLAYIVSVPRGVNNLNGFISYALHCVSK